MHEEHRHAPTCTGKEEDAGYVFFKCLRFNLPRSTWETALKRRAAPDDLEETMLPSDAAYDETTKFASVGLEGYVARSNGGRRSKLRCKKEDCLRPPERSVTAVISLKK